MFNIEITPSPSFNKKDTNNINTGYINEENSNIINSTKLRFENLDELEIEERNKFKLFKQNTENVNVRLDLDIVSTLIRSKTDKGKVYKINTSSDTL